LNEMTPPRRSFRAHVQAVQAELAESTRRGGLANDAYGRVIEAQSAAIGVFPDFVDAVKNAQPQFTAEHLTTISGNLERAINPSVAHAVRMLEWKIPALYLSLALSLIGAAGFAGYSYGHSTGYDLSQSRLTNITVGNQIAATLPAAEANMWATLMRLNDITDVWSGCRSHDQNGGEVCDLSFWVRPPPAKAK
jgi:hypothetical protein